jgi:fibro-slime domain-containing protein
MKRKKFCLLAITILIISAILPSFLITTSVKASDDLDLPEKVVFEATIRDFTHGHPDFENDAYMNFRSGKATKGLVAKELDEEMKPVFAGVERQVITNAETFSQWYRDIDGVNTPIKREIELTLDYGEDGKPFYQFWDNEFFPIDDNLLLAGEKTFGNYPHEEVPIEVRTGSDTFETVMGTRNFHFTTEIESKFMYKGGETFMFIGDDDVWVFIDGKLVIDIGGVHGEVNEKIFLDELDIGLEKGKIYTFHFFHAERHTTESNFLIQTTIDFYTEQEHKMNLFAKNEDGSYSNEASGMVGDIVELEYIFPEQEIDLPETEGLEVTGIKFNFETILPRGLQVVDSGELIKSAVVDERGYISGTKLRQPESGKNFDLEYEFDRSTGKYRIKEYVLKVKVKLITPGAYRLNPEDTVASYSLYYTDGAIVGLHKGNYIAENNVTINVQFRARIEGPDSMYLGEIVTYTAITDLEDATDASFTWNVDENYLKIVEDNGDTVKVKAVGVGKSEISVDIELNGVEESAEKAVEVIWAIDIQ